MFRSVYKLIYLIFCYCSYQLQFSPNDLSSGNGTLNSGRLVPCLYHSVADHLQLNAAVTKCSRDFFLDNSSGLCRPECGEWDQYSPATRRAVYGVTITFALVTVTVCVVTIVWSVFRHKIM